MAIGSVLVLPIMGLQVQLLCKLNPSSLIAISFFNLLFISLLFPLQGPLLRKFILLLIGNCVGTLWYIIQSSLKEAFSSLGTDTFEVITLLVKPVFDFLWVVILWSLSLSVLSSYRKKNERLEESRCGF
jgi:hypothetical protein